MIFTHDWLLPDDEPNSPYGYTFRELPDAICIWANLQRDRPSVAACAASFMTTASLIRDVVRDSDSRHEVFLSSDFELDPRKVFIESEIQQDDDHIDVWRMNRMQAEKRDYQPETIKPEDESSPEAGLFYEVSDQYDTLAGSAHFGFFLDTANTVHDYGYKHRLTPRQIGALLGVALGSLAKWEALDAPDAELAINQYLAFCKAALELGGNQARLELPGHKRRRELPNMTPKQSAEDKVIVTPHSLQ